MDKYWPHRPTPDGFSIEKLAKKYRDRFSKTFPDGIVSTTFESAEEPKNAQIASIHWANRDFREYRDVA